MGAGAARTLGHHHEMVWGGKSRQTEKLRGTAVEKSERKCLTGAEKKGREGEMRDHAPAKTTLQS